MCRLQLLERNDLLLFFSFLCELEISEKKQSRNFEDVTWNVDKEDAET